MQTQAKKVKTHCPQHAPCVLVYYLPVPSVSCLWPVHGHLPPPTVTFLFVMTEVSTWWARQIRSRSCLCRNLATTSEPKVNDTPLSFSPQPNTSLSGSDQSKSHSRPWSGTSVGRMMRLICSMDWRSGDSPKWNSKVKVQINTLILRSAPIGTGWASCQVTNCKDSVSQGQIRNADIKCTQLLTSCIQPKDCRVDSRVLCQNIHSAHYNPPPWQQKIFSSTMAAIGRQLKQSVKVFQSLMLYLLLPNTVRQEIIFNFFPLSHTNNLLQTV